MHITLSGGAFLHARQHRYGKVERDGISVSLAALGKNAEGRALYSLRGFEYTERQIQQDQLRAEALPIVEAHARQGWQAVTEALSQRGIAFGETVAVIKDKRSGENKEVTYAQIERDGISVSLKSLGQNDSGQTLFQARQLQRQQLATDFAAIVNDCNTWKEAEKMATASGIQYSRVRVTTDDDQNFVVGRLERDGITTTTGQAGESHTLRALDDKFMPRHLARDWFDKARLEQKPVEFLVSQGLTASDIDRISRIGEYVEAQRPEAQERDIPTQAQQPNKKKIPSVMSMLSATAEDVETVVLVAQEKLRVSKAKAEAEAAKVAVQEMKNSIETEAKNKPQERPMDDKKTTNPPVSKEKAAQDKALDDKALDRERDLEKMRDREKDAEKVREREKERQRERERERERQRQ